MRIVLAWMLAVVLFSAAEAQTLTRGPVLRSTVSPATIAKRLEQSAMEVLKSSAKGAARGAAVDFSWPFKPEEYRALRKYVLVLVSVVTQDAAELPVRRVYIGVNGHETDLIRLSSQRSDVQKESLTYLALGRYREDGFYLAPAGLMMADGYLEADFAVRRNNFNLYRLPGAAPNFINADSNPMPAADARPEMPALKAMLRREYQGFELPANLR